MPQRTLRFKIHQDGRVEETVEGFFGNSCNDATRNLEDSLGVVKVKTKSSEAYIADLGQNLTKIQKESNVTL